MPIPGRSGRSSAAACGVGQTAISTIASSRIIVASRAESADARLQERPISNTILSRPRRTPELPSLSISHVPTRSRRDTALSLHAPDSHRARYSGSCLNGRLRSPRIFLRAGSKADRAMKTRLRSGIRRARWSHRDRASLDALPLAMPDPGQPDNLLTYGARQDIDLRQRRRAGGDDIRALSREVLPWLQEWSPSQRSSARI